MIRSRNVTPLSGHDARASGAHAHGTHTHGAHTFVFWWLVAICGLVATMVMIGGITRLTGSGLSIVEWRPVAGFLPPLSAAEWQRVFDLYRATPEYAEINFGMGLGDFKAIFFWEYVHRLMGRLLGLAFAVPLVWLAVTRRLPPGLGGRLVLLFFLGAAQGVIGWWMVKSGLSENAAVSQYRLAVHLCMALVILGLLLWTALDVRCGRAPMPGGAAVGVIACVFLTIMAGAIVAGLDAGLLYNQYPLMGDGFVPVEYGDAGALDAFENPASAQFHHRWLGLVSVLAVVWLVFRAGHTPRARSPGLLCLAIVIAQFGLGIIVLLGGAQIAPATLHQSTAVALFVCLLWTAHCMALGHRGNA